MNGASQTRAALLGYVLVRETGIGNIGCNRSHG